MSLSRLRKLEEALAKRTPIVVSDSTDLSRPTVGERRFLKSLGDDVSKFSKAELEEAARLLAIATVPVESSGHGASGGRGFAIECGCCSCKQARFYEERSNQLLKQPTPASVPEGK